MRPAKPSKFYWSKLFPAMRQQGHSSVNGAHLSVIRSRSTLNTKSGAETVFD